MATILVIDDEAPIVDILKTLLQEEGYEVVTAANGREGLRLIEREPPDLVLCDVMMPMVDGRTLCRTLRNDPNLSDIPVVLMSAVRDIVARDDCGYVAFIPKPFDFDSLLRTIATQLNLAEMRESPAS